MSLDVLADAQIDALDVLADAQIDALDVLADAQSLDAGTEFASFSRGRLSGLGLPRIEHDELAALTRGAVRRVRVGAVPSPYLLRLFSLCWKGQRYETVEKLTSPLLRVGRLIVWGS